MNPLVKNTYREILRSPGRFLAILAIIVLGSGFFVGLRVSQKAMTATADTYFEKTKLYDFSAAATLGLTEEDVEAMREEPGVLDAEGSFETDALVNFGDNIDLVYAFYSLPERINLPDLVEGRLPENENECLADSWAKRSIGDKIYISETNDEDTLALFKARELTVVGICTSPLYLNFERGSTSLGSGSVTSFCYVTEDVFDADYYTGVYIRCTDMPGAYSAAYDDRSEALEGAMTALAEARADARYSSIVADAESELADGQKEYDEALETYNTERADAEGELADAWQELEDARVELEDAAAQIEDGKQEIADGKKELSDNWIVLLDAKRELDDAKVQLDDAKAQLDDGWDEYDQGVSELAEERFRGQRELDDAKAQLDDAKAQLNDAKKVIDDSQAELAGGEREYADNLALYEDGVRQYEDGLKLWEDSKKALEDGESEYESGMAEYRSGRSQYNDGLDALRAGKEKLDASKAQLDAGQGQFDALTEAILEGINQLLPNPYESVDALLADVESGNTIAAFAVNTALTLAQTQFPDMENIPADSAALLETRNQLSAGWALYESGLADYNANSAYLDSVGAELSSARAQLRDARAQLDDGWAELEEGRVELDNSKIELEDAKAQLDEGRAALNEGWSQLRDGIREYNAGVAEYQSGLADYEAGVEEFNTSVAEAEQKLSDANDELLEAQTKYEDGLADYEDGVRAYQDGLRQYYDGESEIAQAELDLAEAEQKYADGLAEYEDGLAEYDDAQREADQEFADAEAELADAERELADARREIDDIEYPDTFLLGRWGNVGYACFESDASIVKSVSAVFPVFFFLVAALICLTTVSRMVEEQRSQLGVLMAMGYSKLAVMGKFLVYSGLATVLGGVIGILLGSKVIPLVIWQAYKIMYSFSDDIQFTFDMPLSAGTFFAYLAAMLAVTYISCSKALNDVPANIIRPRAPKAGKRVLLERIPIIWNRLSFLWKVTVRNIFRYKARVFMMILGIAGCTALMMTGMGINDSIQNVVDYQFTEISLYDFTVTFSDHLDEAARDAFMDEVSDLADGALFLHQSSFTASANRTEKEVYVNAVDAEHLDRVSEFVDFHHGSTPLPFPGEDEALINSGLADSLSLKPGDTIELRDDEGIVMELTVSGVYDNYIYNNIYIGTDTYAKYTGGDADINYALVLKNDAVTTGDALAEILGMDDVLTATASLDLRERIGSMMESLIYIVLLTIVCAAALAFVVIYNLTNINIQERLRELATVKVLGFYDLESALYVLRENVLLTIIGAAVGVPMGLALNAYVVGQIDLDMIHFTPRVLPMSYVYSIALTILFSLLVDALMYLRLKKINPAEALKAAE